ncbi:4-phosphoerythronate dehydrogenase [Candidatus Sororendozoicomonas aggregata]|uniref:4-phosphoerythronate dehydrogenase n=1 Tax=Candidatus Sororendozoicomonas aggregata TaxID=3073239 RepID=UPI002ED32BB8
MGGIGHDVFSLIGVGFSFGKAAKKQACLHLNVSDPGKSGLSVNGIARLCQQNLVWQAVFRSGKMTFRMKIVADENIPLLNACFGDMAEIVTLPGRVITARDVRDADALLVRSVTPVNDALVAGSSLRFVGTATAGIDHIDSLFLKAHGVGFASAPGCNAVAVSEYVLAALDNLAEKYRFSLSGKTAGIVGFGQVGRQVAAKLDMLGLRVLVSDPLCEQKPGVTFVTLDQLINKADIITLHAPLTSEGDYPTYHMINAQRLAAIKSGAVLISAGRGAVVDNQALKACLKRGKDLKVVCDVWESEPDFDSELMAKVAIATPHIAGYSLDGKIKGTLQVYQSFCRHFQLRETVDTKGLFPTTPELGGFHFGKDVSFYRVMSLLIRAVYDIGRDDTRMRQLGTMTKTEKCAAFDRMRRQYPVRRELSAVTVSKPDSRNQWVNHLSALGVHIQKD